MSLTSTYTNTDTYTESRARYVMGKMYDDLINLIGRRFKTLSQDRVNDWKEDIWHLLTQKALYSFQLQFTLPGGKELAIQYDVKADGTIQADNESGNIDFYDLPETTSVNICIRRDHSRNEITTYMQKRGYSPSGKMLEGTETYDASYSKEGFGVNRKKIGSW